jgi:hypothetical protein
VEALRPARPAVAQPQLVLQPLPLEVAQAQQQPAVLRPLREQELTPVQPQPSPPRQ